MACESCGQDCWVSRGTRAGAPADSVVSCVECISGQMERLSGQVDMVREAFRNAFTITDADNKEA